MMRVAFLTTDEVNVELARQCAAECGAHLQRILPKDGVPNGRFDAVCYDLDDAPPERRAEILRGLLSRPTTRPTAVHGYGLNEDQVGRLRRRGVVVAQHLEPKVFWTLLRAVDLGLSTVPPDDAADDDTWIAPAL